MKRRTHKKHAARIRYEIHKTERLWRDSHLRWVIVACGERLAEQIGMLFAHPPIYDEEQRALMSLDVYRPRISPPSSNEQKKETP